MEYQVGDYLVHEGSGVCQIEDIDDMELMGKGSRKTYYCMSPVFKAGAKVFTPIIGSTVKLRPVAEEARFAKILDNIDDIQCIEEPNDRMLQERFKEVMGEFTPESLARVVKTVLIRKWQRIEAGKKVMAIDEKILSVAGRKLYEEMAFSMGKDIPSVQHMFEDAVKVHSSNTILLGA
ncbi:transcriptional regulator, CarD family [Pseudobutyrivibrio sp. YE44]|uniref:CarD family transcriptional regulator n=1 Tax=Pseudobutyrivibrio sp. YE44 TaxID=1520802 RepID=UPI0008808C93|nr:CarD family transcriptional regulator [Pseudobutyrivibrio sp. YE44]SDB33190.1 transcriptional regulator, CarD family [Pseudobutyrivibrio sp. YE44]